MFDFGFGDAPGVRKVLAAVRGTPNVFLKTGDLYYHDKHGNPELIGHIKVLIKKFTGLEYNNVLIVAGAEHGINTLLRALKPTMTKLKGTNLCAISYNSPHFSHYRGMSDRAGYYPVGSSMPGVEEFIRIIDSPSNPQGSIVSSDPLSAAAKYVIWDGVYHNPVYSKKLKTYPAHDFYVGSLGKLLGLPGIRLGWVAFNDHVSQITRKPALKTVVDEIYSETLGVSGASQMAANEIFFDLSLDSFLRSAGVLVDSNREEMRKLEYLSGTVVPENGMFYYMQVDSKVRALFDQNKVKYIAGEDIGGDSRFIRLNLAQTQELTKQMVDSIRRADNK